MSANRKRQQERARRRQEQKRRRGAAAAPNSATSTPRRREGSRSPGPQAAEIATLERLDAYAGLRNALSELAVGNDEWAGIPMPLDGLRLVVEPRYPRAAELMAISMKPDVEDRRRVRSTFWSSKMRSQIVVWEEDGRIGWGLIPGVHGAKYMLQTLFASAAWGVEQEARAVQTLAGLVRHHQFKQYMLTGMFMEKSPRSGLTYLFRRLRPTVAIDARSGSEDGDALIIACLCLHPIGYYDGSWAGAMCPTDDVIAHMMLMRGDEPMFWRRSNQHPPWHPAAGL